jgi:hypothetical protein
MEKYENTFFYSKENFMKGNSNENTKSIDFK